MAWLVVVPLSSVLVSSVRCIDEVEATMNFSLSLGFLSAEVNEGIYLAMHGVVVEATKLLKDRKKGQFLISE